MSTAIRQEHPPLTTPPKAAPPADRAEREHFRAIWQVDTTGKLIRIASSL
ncbi:MAG TPA: hypothetical protein V6D06_12450 [Trichocoleus sp.]